MNYYNEIDAYAADWLENLMLVGLLPAGKVDRRSIVDVEPADLAGFTQCHFFAGIGGWSLALSLAGWPEDRPVWTGSCPCQPFSAAGKQKGDKDERHLWPEFFRLIAECRPATVFGEQVASKLGREWLAGVFTDLESVGYAAAGADLCAAGVGAPHIRQRLWWVGSVADTERCVGDRRADEQERGSQGRTADRGVGAADVSDGRLADSTSATRERNAGEVPGAKAQVSSKNGAEHGDRPERPEHGGAGVGVWGESGGLADAPNSDRRRRECGAQAGVGPDEIGRRRPRQRGDDGGLGNADSNGSAAGLPESAPGQEGDAGKPIDAGSSLGAWDSFVWLPCADGKARRIEPGTAPLAHGIPARVGKLRAYGNAIVPQVAAEFIRAVEECRP